MKLSRDLSKIGVVGIFIAAILSPCCFPLFAFVASTLGLGSFELFGGWTMWVFQGMVMFSLVGFYLSFRKNRLPMPLIIATSSAILIFLSYHFDFGESWIYYMYIGMFGLLGATLLNMMQNKKQNSCKTCMTIGGRTVELLSVLTCPECGHKKQEIMPTDACAFFYECDNCHTRLRPKQGDCCVYCSYGSMACPPIQLEQKCC